MHVLRSFRLVFLSMPADPDLALRIFSLGLDGSDVFEGHIESCHNITEIVVKVCRAALGASKVQFARGIPG